MKLEISHLSQGSIWRFGAVRANIIICASQEIMLWTSGQQVHGNKHKQTSHMHVVIRTFGQGAPKIM